MAKKVGRGLTVRETLLEALAWTRADIRGFEDIAPTLDMLKARARVLRRAIKRGRV